jgi:hypothetical protein
VVKPSCGFYGCLIKSSCVLDLDFLLFVLFLFTTFMQISFNLPINSRISEHLLIKVLHNVVMGPSDFWLENWLRIFASPVFSQVSFGFELLFHRRVDHISDFHLVETILQNEVTKVD